MGDEDRGYMSKPENIVSCLPLLDKNCLLHIRVEDRL